MVYESSTTSTSVFHRRSLSAIGTKAGFGWGMTNAGEAQPESAQQASTAVQPIRRINKSVEAQFRRRLGDGNDFRNGPSQSFGGGSLARSRCGRKAGCGGVGSGALGLGWLGNGGGWDGGLGFGCRTAKGGNLGKLCHGQSNLFRIQRESQCLLRQADLW